MCPEGGGRPRSEGTRRQAFTRLGCAGAAPQPPESSAAALWPPAPPRGRAPAATSQPTRDQGGSHAGAACSPDWRRDARLVTQKQAAAARRASESTAPCAPVTLALGAPGHCIALSSTAAGPMAAMLPGGGGGSICKRRGASRAGWGLRSARCSCWLGRKLFAAGAPAEAAARHRASCAVDTACAALCARVCAGCKALGAAARMARVATSSLRADE